MLAAAFFSATVDVGMPFSESNRSAAISGPNTPTGVAVCRVGERHYLDERSEFVAVARVTLPPRFAVLAWLWFSWRLLA